MNPNKTSLFEDSLLRVWVDFTPLPFTFQEELIQYQYNFIQLLNNLSEVV